MSDSGVTQVPVVELPELEISLLFDADDFDRLGHGERELWRKALRRYGPQAWPFCQEEARCRAREVLETFDPEERAVIQQAATRLLRLEELTMTRRNREPEPALNHDDQVREIRNRMTAMRDGDGKKDPRRRCVPPNSYTTDAGPCPTSTQDSAVGSNLRRQEPMAKRKKATTGRKQARRAKTLQPAVDEATLEKLKLRRARQFGRSDHRFIPEQVNSIRRKFWLEGATITKLAAEFGCSRPTIFKICSGTVYRAIPFPADVLEGLDEDEDGHADPEGHIGGDL